MVVVGVTPEEFEAWLNAHPGGVLLYRGDVLQLWLRDPGVCVVTRGAGALLESLRHRALPGAVVGVLPYTLPDVPRAPSGPPGGAPGGRPGRSDFGGRVAVNRGGRCSSSDVPDDVVDELSRLASKALEAMKVGKSDGEASGRCSSGSCNEAREDEPREEGERGTGSVTSEDGPRSSGR